MLAVLHHDAGGHLPRRCKMCMLAGHGIFRAVGHAFRRNASPSKTLRQPTRASMKFIGACDVHCRVDARLPAAMLLRQRRRRRHWRHCSLPLFARLHQT